MGFKRKVGHPANRSRAPRLTALLVIGWLVIAGLGVVAVLNAEQLADEVSTRRGFHQRVAATRLLHIAALKTEGEIEALRRLVRDVETSAHDLARRLDSDGGRERGPEAAALEAAYARLAAEVEGWPKPGVQAPPTSGEATPPPRQD